MIRAAIVAFSLLLAGPALAQFAEAQSPCHGCTPAEVAHIDMIKKQEEAARGLQAAPQAISGPIGSPAFVLKPPSDGFITIGKPFGDFLEPYIDSVAQLLIYLLISWLCLEIKKRTGIEVDEKHRQALLDAATRQASSLVADGMVKVEGTTINVHSPALAHAADEAMKVVPDAAKRFGITPEVFAQRIVDELPKLAAMAQTLASAHAADATAKKLP